MGGDGCRRAKCSRKAATDVSERCMPSYITYFGGGLMDCLLDYPRAWSIDSERAAQGYKGEGDADQEIEEGTDSEDESEAEDDSDADVEGGNDAPGSSPNAQPSLAFREFLGFLELGCAGYAVEGYQLVLVVVAGIPETVSVALVADHWHQVPYFG